jgi:predicted metal-dependent hydrolase
MDAPMRATRQLFALTIPAKRGSAARRATAERQLAFSFDAPAVRVEPPRVVVIPPAAPIETTPDECVARPRTRTSHELRDEIAAALGVRVEIELTRNRRTMISSTKAKERLVVRLHEMFEEADGTIVKALTAYLKNGDRHASRLLGTFIESHREHLVSQRPPPKLRTRGNHYDLSSLFEQIGRAHFPDALEGVNITWGKRGKPMRGKSRKRTIRLGTYTHDERLIRVHPVLDHAWVPPFFIEYIIFHEMLHHVEPAREEHGRTIFHTPEFRRRERAYPDYVRALEWERANINKLLSG